MEWRQQRQYRLVVKLHISKRAYPDMPYPGKCPPTFTLLARMAIAAYTEMRYIEHATSRQYGLFQLFNEGDNAIQA